MFGVRVRDAHPGVIRLVGVRVLRGNESRLRSIIHSGLVVSHEVGVGTRAGKLWVMMTSGGVVNGGVVLLLQK